MDPADAKGFVPNVAMTLGVVVKNNLVFVNDFIPGCGSCDGAEDAGSALTSKTEDRR